MSNRFDKYSDSQLIILYNKYSDEDAFAELLFRHNDLIEYLAGKVFVDGYDKEDIKQICLMSFLSAIKSYDPQKGVAFGTFAQSCLKHRLAQLVRDSLTKGRSNEEYSITSYDTLDYEIADSAAVYDDSHVTNNLIVNDTYAILQKVLSSQEYNVFYLYTLGYSYLEIASNCNMTRKQVDNSICRARKKLCDYFNRHGN